MTVLITLTTAGADSGPFNLYSDLDGYISAFESGVTKVDLLAGYNSSFVPDGTNIIRIMSDSELCTNYIDIEIVCIRPSGLSNKVFYNSYNPPVGPSVDFTISFSTACAYLYTYDTTPSSTLSGSTNQTSSFIVGDTVYKGLLTNCTEEEDGYYITDLITREITQVLAGQIASISYCTTTTTTTIP